MMIFLKHILRFVSRLMVDMPFLSMLVLKDVFLLLVDYHGILRSDSPARKTK